MSSRKRFFLALVLLVGILTISTIGMATATVYRCGSIRIQVQSNHTGGDNINMVFPAALAELALALAPAGLLKDEIPADEIEPYLPVILELAKQVEALPDGVFVKVTGPSETVLVEKRNGSFIIEVQDRNESVRISVPVDTVATFMRKARTLV